MAKIVLVDKKCNECGKVKEDRFLDESDTCCGAPMGRTYGYRKYSEFIPGYYAHFTGEDIYLESAKDYKKACKKYHVAQEGGRGLYDREF